VVFSCTFFFFFQPPGLSRHSPRLFVGCSPRRVPPFSQVFLHFLRPALPPFLLLLRTDQGLRIVPLENVPGESASLTLLPFSPGIYFSWFGAFSRSQPLLFSPFPPPRFFDSFFPSRLIRLHFGVPSSSFPE